jgi:hypothetical protein
MYKKVSPLVTRIDDNKINGANKEVQKSKIFTFCDSLADTKPAEYLS